MKRALIIFTLIALFLAACASGTQEGPEKAADKLLVSGGDIQKTYIPVDLESLPASQSVFKDVTYIGVSLAALLQDAGFNPQEVEAVKAVAADGFASNYDPELFLREDVLVSYARADGPLTEEDGTFRMVLPGEEGKLNVRMLTELQVIQ